MQRLDGHIFQRLTPWVRTKLPNMSDRCVGNSRCHPVLLAQLREVEEKFATCHNRIVRKIWCNAIAQQDYVDGFDAWSRTGIVNALNGCLRKLAFLLPWKVWACTDPHILDESEVISLRPLLTSLVVTHIEKLFVEGMIL